MTMTPRASLAAALLLSTGIAHAQDPPVSKPADVVARLVEEHEASELGYQASYAEFKPRFEAFVEAHRGTEAEVTAQLWLMKQAWWLRQEGKMEETAIVIADDLLARHPESKQLAVMPQVYYVFDKKQRKRICGELLASPHAEVQASAHLGLAKLSPPKPGWREAGATVEEVHPHLAALAARYAEVPYLFTTYGAMAHAYLNPHTAEELAVGATAPEIVGIDENGEPMKLSSFRGKVVMLDFWGEW